MWDWQMSAAVISRTRVPDPKADTRSTSWGSLNPYRASKGRVHIVAGLDPAKQPTFWKTHLHLSCLPWEARMVSRAACPCVEQFLQLGRGG
jgi:hypothetical protein